MFRPCSIFVDLHIYPPRISSRHPGSFDILDNWSTGHWFPISGLKYIFEQYTICHLLKLLNAKDIACRYRLLISIPARCIYLVRIACHLAELSKIWDNLSIDHLGLPFGGPYIPSLRTSYYLLDLAQSNQGIIYICLIQQVSRDSCTYLPCNPSYYQ